MGGEFSVEKPASMAAWRKTCYSVSLDKEGCLKWGQEKWVRKRGKWGAQVEHFPRLREWSEAKDFFLFVMSMKITQQHHLQNTSSVKAFILFLEDQISSNIEKKDHWEIGCLKKKDPGGGRHAFWEWEEAHRVSQGRYEDLMGKSQRNRANGYQNSMV